MALTLCLPKSSKKIFLTLTLNILLLLKNCLGTVARAYNPNTLGGRGGRIMRLGVQDQSGQYGETPSLLKNTKISQAWGCASVVPATQEAEAEESLRTQEAEVAVS